MSRRLLARKPAAPLWRRKQRRRPGFVWEEPASVPSPLSSESQQRRLEAIMKRTCVAILALLSLSSAALAQGEANAIPVSRQDIARAVEPSMSHDPASPTLLQLGAVSPASNRHSWERHYLGERSQWRPFTAAPYAARYGAYTARYGATPYTPRYGVGGNGAVYLNGWSSSNDPGDCNKGCVNSN
jgi:hypothetical protein